MTVQPIPSQVRLGDNILTVENIPPPPTNTLSFAFLTIHNEVNTKVYNGDFAMGGLVPLGEDHAGTKGPWGGFTHDLRQLPKTYHVS